MPGDRLELGTEQLQQLAGDVPVMFLVPDLGQAAAGVLQLGQQLLKVAVARCDRAALAAPPGIPQAVDGDRPEPVAKCPFPAIVLELRQSADDNGENFLGDVVAVGLADLLATEPVADQR